MWTRNIVRGRRCFEQRSFGPKRGFLLYSVSQALGEVSSRGLGCLWNFASRRQHLPASGVDRRGGLLHGF